MSPWSIKAFQGYRHTYPHRSSIGRPNRGKSRHKRHLLTNVHHNKDVDTICIIALGQVCE